MATVLKDYVQVSGRPHKVHLAPMGRYNYPRIHSELEKNPVDRRATSDTGAGFPKKPGPRVAKRAHLETRDLLNARIS